MTESIHLQNGAPCKDGDNVKVCFEASVEIGNAYYVSVRCEDATGSCECCNSQMTEGYFAELTEAKNPVWRDCVLVPLSNWDGCKGCGCCRVVLYLNQGDIGGGFAVASVEVLMPTPLPDC